MSEPEPTPGTIDRFSAFISYSSKDREVAMEVCGHLEERGLRCWIAPRNVRAGRDYGEEIIRGIERSNCLVLILSEHANDSRPVKDEVERAYSKGKPVFPLRIEDVPPSRGLEFFISSSHWIDAWGGDLAQHVQRLADSLSGEEEHAAFPVTGLQIRRRLQAVGLAWPLVAGLAVLGLVLAIWRLSGDSHGIPDAEEMQKLQDQALQQMNEQLGGALGDDTTRLMQPFDPALITTESVGVRIEPQGSRLKVQMDYPIWFSGQFNFRRNVRQLLYSTDGQVYTPSTNTRRFYLSQGSASDKLYVKYVLADGTELEPLVFDADLAGQQLGAAEAVLAQQLSSACQTGLRQRGCIVAAGVFSALGGAVKNVKLSQSQDFDENVFTVPAPADRRSYIQYHPPPDARRYFVRFEMKSGEESRVFAVPVEPGDWPHWTRLQGRRESGDASLDARGFGTLYAAYDPRVGNASWLVWGPLFDCERLRLRYAVDEKGLLGARCSSHALEVRAPGESRMLLVEYVTEDGREAVYRYALDYRALAIAGMQAGLEDQQDWLRCSARAGASLTCQWGSQMQWRLPGIARVEFGPTASNLSGQAAVPIDLDEFFASADQRGQLYAALRKPVVDVKEPWTDLFARLVLEGGDVTDVRRMAVTRY